MRVYLLLLLTLIMTGCSTVNCNFTGDNNRVTIEQPKTVQTSTDATVPLSP